MLRVLRQDELEFFDANGYLVVKGVIPAADCQAVIDAIFDFLEFDANDPDTWYPEFIRGGGMVYMHQHPALWKNRENERLYGAFADLVGTEKLWVTIDRAGMKPPINPKYPHYQENGFVHWDINMDRPMPEKPRLQGVVSLTDTTEQMGGFRCVPGIHRVIEQWLADHPKDRETRQLSVDELPEELKVTPIAAEQGDLIIWAQTLAHGNGRNEGDRPRLAQYITMHPAGEDNEAYRQARIECFRRQEPPEGFARAVPEQFVGREKRYPQAELSPLGRKLLGLDRWE